MNNLVIDILKKKYPYYQDNNSPENICWGKIKLTITRTKNELIKTVIDLEWHYDSLLIWFYNNKEYLLKDHLPKINIINIDGSIAQYFYDFYNSEKDFDDIVYDNFWQYRNKHCLSFALSGTDTKDIYIGLNKEKYEISYFSKNENWTYEIKLIEFLNSLDFDPRKN